MKDSTTLKTYITLKPDNIFMIGLGMNFFK